jgi:hypothetical protein
MNAGRMTTRGFGRVVWGIILLTLVLLIAAVHSFFSLDQMPAYGIAVTNAPPAWTGAFGTNTTIRMVVPYGQVTNKPVSESEIEKVKVIVPTTRTTLRLYQPYRIVVESPTEMTFEFTRARRGVSIWLEKTNGVWSVQDIHTHLSKYGSHSPPLSFWDKLNDALPF